MRGCTVWRTATGGGVRSSVRLFEAAEPLERGNDAGHVHVGQSLRRNDHFGLGAPGTPDGGVRAAEKDQAGNMEGGGDMRRSAIVADEERGARQESFGCSQVRLKHPMSVERRGVVRWTRQEDWRDVPQLQITS